jgi:hypothetical protein
MKRLAVTAAVAALLSAPAAGLAQDGVDYTVYFPFDSAALTSQARATVAEAAEDYRDTGSAAIVLEGHTDTVASQDYNLDLSRRRAQAVEQALAEQGVPRGDIEVEALGETDLAVQTGEGVRNQQNRRVTINLVQPMPEQAPPPMAEPEPRERVLGFTFAVAPYFGWGLSTDDDNDDDSYMPGLNLTAGYRLTDFVHFEAEQAVFWTFADGDNGIGGRSVAGVNLQTQFAGGLVPYLGANIGGVYTDSDFDSAWIAGPEIGLRWRFVEAKVAYDMPFDRDWDEGVVSATVGALFRF